jgi:sigma-B regulation protein RsbU (phosphoserine phosphatase)
MEIVGRPRALARGPWPWFMSASLRVLVADDQSDILQALRLLLSDAGFQTELVGSVEDVVDRVGREPYDLLLMDLNYTRDTTSGREGLELIDRVRAHDGTLPIVVMTGWGSIETAVEAMRRGAKSFVQKPWDDTTLVEVVRREADEGRANRRRDARVAREHEDARQIQRALLPSVMPAIDGCSIYALWTPAAGVGGDCYDLLRFTNSRVGISIADVIGKGVPAALLMSNLQAAVRAFATASADPQDVCGSVNRLLCRNIESGKFVTFCYVDMDTEARTLRYANAGHFPPILVRADGRVDRLPPTGIVLGVSPEWRYQPANVDLRAGDRLVCFTDGITEAESPAGDPFGEERLAEMIARHRGEPAETLARVVLDNVNGWTETGPQDDATLIVVAID